MCTERYVDIFTDFGFKLLFGTPENKEFLIDFLNRLLEPEHPIIDISYNNTEIFGKSPDDRKAVYDLYCTTADGAHIIVEMQNAYQRYFMDRTIFYSSFPIQAVARKGDWDYQLPEIYTVAFLNFTLNGYEDVPSFKHVMRLTDVETKRVFYDKLTFIYLEMPKFDKRINEIDNMMDAWMFVIKNLSRLDEKPKRLKDAIFERFFSVAEIANFTPEQRVAYEASLKNMRDYINTIRSAEEKGIAKGKAEGMAEGEKKGRAEGMAEGEKKGRAEGMAEGLAEGEKKGKMEVARTLLSHGMPPDKVAAIIGFTPDEIAGV